MNMNRAHVLLVALLLWPQAGSASVEKQLTEDELLFMEIPTVVTASRKPQPINEAPASVFVVTAEDIKYSGALSIPDALRLVPGIDVFSITVRNQSVAVRGLPGDVYSSKLLVMIDGRTVCWDVYGTVLWETLPITLSEVDRIEVIRSPVSSLYGSNAVSGVINIITRRPEQIDGLEMSITGGEYGTMAGSAVFGRAGKRLALRLSGEYNATDEWSGSDEPAGTLERFNGFLQYRINDKATVALSGGRLHTEGQKYFPDELVGTVSLTGNSDYVQADAAVGRWLLRSFLRREDSRMRWVRTGLDERWVTFLVDAGLEHSFDIAQLLSVVWGANYRYNGVDANSVIPEDHGQNLFGLFADAELHVGVLRANAGLRYDWHPLTHSRVSPRASIALTPNPDHTIRLSGASAYRNPTYVDAYVDFAQVIDTFVGIPINFRVAGAKDLKPEQVFSTELSYQSTWLRRLSADLSLFYRYYTHLYQAHLDTIYAPQFEVVRTPVDDRTAHGCGGELALNGRVTDWLAATGSYTTQYLWADEQTGGEGFGAVRSGPRHTLRAGLRAKLRGAWAGVSVHWSDRTTWSIEDTLLQAHTQKLPGHTLVNASLGYEYKNAEISVAVFDLFDRWYYEYPSGIGLPDESSDALHQKVSVTLTGKF